MGARVTLRAPVPLADHHALDTFDSGVPSLDEWLRRRARANQVGGGSRTFVVCAGDDPTVIAYYALAAGGVAQRGVPGRFKRNMPDPIPVAVLGRLAVDRTFQGRGLGRALVRDAVLRVDQAAEQIGVRGILVEAMSDEARTFYAALGFTSLAEHPHTLVATLVDLRNALASVRPSAPDS